MKADELISAKIRALRILQNRGIKEAIRLYPELADFIRKSDYPGIDERVDKLLRELTEVNV